MSYFMLVILAVTVYKMKLAVNKKNYFSDYMSIEKTTSIKGLFILLIFLSHAVQYIKMTKGFSDTSYMLFRDYLGQSVVSMFFFYSGFGILEAISKKGSLYIKSFPKYRISKVLVHFDIAVLIYLAVGFAIGKKYTFGRIILALTGFSAVGNSNWFIFDILIAYIITYISFSVFKNTDKKALSVAAVTVLSLVFVVIMALYMPSRYYNTFLCFAMGMWFSLYKDSFDKFTSKLPCPALITLIGVIAAVYFAIPYLNNKYLEAVQTLLFSAAFVIMTRFVSFNNPILYWFGKRSFSLFILMRIPMIIIKQFGLYPNNALFVIETFIISVAFTACFDLFIQKLDGVFFKPKKRAVVSMHKPIS